MPDWNNIDTVLLDMDGTLLDLHFDNHFWQTHVPRRFADFNDISSEEASARILPHMREIRGTLDWYSIHYWSDYLSMDIPTLKLEVAHLIRLRPGVNDFLGWLQNAGKHVVLATNAHPDTVEIKFSRVALGEYFDDIICSHDLDAPKESQDFWHALEKRIGFKRARSLLVDDNVSVLDAARDYGIGWLLSIAQPDLKAPPQEASGYAAVEHFSQIVPGS